MASRAASVVAIAVGSLIGGSAALVSSKQSPAPGSAPYPPLHALSAPPPSASSTAVPPAPPSAEAPPPAPASASASSQPEPAPESPVPHGFGDLIPSPHDHPIRNEEELRKAERLCIADLPYQCMRVADVYREGELVPADGRRHSQYRNLAFRLYIKQCESHSIEACYSLARMYLRGDGVKANPSYAQNLMRRVLELCGYKRVKLCQRLETEAPEVVERYREKPGTKGR